MPATTNIEVKVTLEPASHTLPLVASIITLRAWAQLNELEWRTGRAFDKIEGRMKLQRLLAFDPDYEDWHRQLTEELDAYHWKKYRRHRRPFLSRIRRI